MRIILNDLFIVFFRGGGGVDYYTLTCPYYDDDDERYEEDSIPGMGSGGSPSSGSPTGYLSKLPPGFLPSGMPEVKDVRPAVTRQEEEAAKAAKAKEKAEEGYYYYYCSQKCWPSASGLKRS